MNNLKNGEYKEWYSEGIQLKSQYNYINGKIEGKCIYWYSNGKLKAIYYFIDGMKNGRMKEWWKNGNLKFDIIYANDKYHGEYKVYFRNGQIKKQINYINGIPEGKGTEWYKNGNIRCEYEWSNYTYMFQSEYKTWFSQLNNGKPKLMNITKFINDNPDKNIDSEYKEWYPMNQGGNLKFQYQLHGDFKHGSYKEWYNNGKLKMEGEYNMDELKWIKKWNKKGKIIN